MKTMKFEMFLKLYEKQKQLLKNKIYDRGTFRTQFSEVTNFSLRFEIHIFRDYEEIH